jgi:hypothetical protein
MDLSGWGISPGVLRLHASRWRSLGLLLEPLSAILIKDSLFNGCLMRWCRQMLASPAILACAPLSLVRTDTVLLLLLCGACSHCVCLLPSPEIAGATVADARCLVRCRKLRAVPSVLLATCRASRPSTATQPSVMALFS